MGSIATEKSGLLVGRFSAVAPEEPAALGEEEEEEARKRDLVANAGGERKRVAAIADGGAEGSSSVTFASCERGCGTHAFQFSLCKREREILGAGSWTGRISHVEELGTGLRVRNERRGSVSRHGQCTCQLASRNNDTFSLFHHFHGLAIFVFCLPN
ncbi:hypothetical protein NL676_028375 [Syzygium grande]|nr:hypothetical protein NL676_028375 [Syzygium grande]